MVQSMSFFFNLKKDGEKILTSEIIMQGPHWQLQEKRKN